MCHEAWHGLDARHYQASVWGVSKRTGITWGMRRTTHGNARGIRRTCAGVCSGGLAVAEFRFIAQPRAEGDTQAMRDDQMRVFHPLDLLSGVCRDANREMRVSAE